jgi:hypothetical protein
MRGTGTSHNSNPGPAFVLTTAFIIEGMLRFLVDSKVNVQKNYNIAKNEKPAQFKAGFSFC